VVGEKIKEEVEGITKNIEIKKADEMAETGYLAYRIKKR
jgi:hypothetical protein